jgi:hypothetical protein
MTEIKPVYVRLKVGTFVHCLDTNYIYEYVGNGRLKRIK